MKVDALAGLNTRAKSKAIGPYFLDGGIGVGIDREKMARLTKHTDVGVRPPFPARSDLFWSWWRSLKPSPRHERRLADEPLLMPSAASTRAVRGRPTQWNRDEALLNELGSRHSLRARQAG